MPVYKRRAGSKPVFNRDPRGLLDKTYPKSGHNLLKRVDDWDFNIFALDRFTGGQPLLTLGLRVFEQHKLIGTFRLDITRLVKTLRSIEETYHAKNPYHNAIHAADVTQAVHCYIRDPKLRPLLNRFDSLCCLLGAMCHDSDHPGVNQAFLEKTENYLVRFYNSKSVLENHHWHVAFSIFHDTGLFNHFSVESWENVKKYIRSLILATDISQQTNYLTRFVALVEQKKMDVANNEEHRLLMLQMALKCADICNPCRVWSVCCSWANLVCEEFFRQGDRERHLGFPIGGQNDRYLTTPIKIQIGFIEFLVKPLFKQWHNFVQSPISERMCQLTESNLAKWRAKMPVENKDNHNNSCVNGKSGVEENRSINKIPFINMVNNNRYFGINDQNVLYIKDDVSEAGDSETAASSSLLYSEEEMEFPNITHQPKFCDALNFNFKSSTRRCSAPVLLNTAFEPQMSKSLYKAFEKQAFSNENMGLIKYSRQRSLSDEVNCYMN